MRILGVIVFSVGLIGAAFQVAAQELPKGAVVAFNLKECPKGWKEMTKELAGRVIVGGGAGAGLSKRALGQTGGEEKHTLSIAEMPAHTHEEAGYAKAEFENVDKGQGLAFAQRTQTGSTGGSEAHNTMPPFFVLTYCEKK